MITRYKWFRVQVSGDKNIEHEIELNLFKDHLPFGFVKLYGPREVPQYRFIWKNEVVIARVGIDNAPHYERIQTLSFLDFSILRQFDTCFIRLINPGRDTRSFLAALESIIGLGFTAQLLTLEKQLPKKIFKDMDIVKLVSLKTVGAVIGQDLVARIDIASKQGMSLEDISIFSGISYKIDSACYEIHYGGVRGSLAYASSGLVKIGGNLSERLLSLLESDLLKPRKKHL